MKVEILTAPENPGMKNPTTADPNNILAISAAWKICTIDKYRDRRHQEKSHRHY